MGIKKFIKYLNNNLNYNNVEIIQENSNLFIDGYSFLFYIIKGIKIYELYLNDNYYNILNNIIVNEINKLKLFKFNLYFYFDGNQTQFKKETKLKRLEEIKLKWKNLHSYLNKEDNSKHSNDNNLPIPTLSFDQLIITLLSLKLPVYFCNGEADQEIALACKTSIESNQSSYCYCNDR